MDENIFSRRLGEARQRLGWSKQGLAQRIGVTEAALRQYERGTTAPSLERLRSLAAVLDVSLDWLCGQAENSPAGTGSNGAIDVTPPASASDNLVTDLLSAREGKAPMDEDIPPGSSWEYVARQLAVAMRVTAQAQADQAAANREQAAANHALANAMTTNQETMAQWWAARPPHAITPARPAAGEEP